MNKYHDFRSFFVWKHIRVKRGIVDIPWEILTIMN